MEALLLNLVGVLYPTLGLALLAVFANIFRVIGRNVAMDIIQIFAAWNNTKTDMLADRAKIRLMEDEAIERLHNSRAKLLGGGS